MGKRTIVFSLCLVLGALVALPGCTSSETAASPTAAAQAPTAAPKATTAPTQAPEATTAPTSAPAPTKEPTKAPAKAPTVDWGEMSFEQVVTAPNAPPQTLKMYVKQQNMRMEIDAQGENVIWIVNNDEQSAYMWMPDQDMAMKMSFDQYEEQQGMEADAGEISEEALGGKMVGTETVDGKVCDVYEYSTAEGTAKTWIWQEKGFPLRTEVTTGEGKITSEFKNVQFGGVADDLFKLPADVQVMDFGGLPGLLPTPQQ